MLLAVILALNQGVVWNGMEWSILVLARYAARELAFEADPAMRVLAPPKSKPFFQGHEAEVLYSVDIQT